MVPHDLTPDRSCETEIVEHLRWAPRVFLRHNLLTEQERLTILEYAKSKIGYYFFIYLLFGCFNNELESFFRC